MEKLKRQISLLEEGKFKPTDFFSIPRIGYSLPPPQNSSVFDAAALAAETSTQRDRSDMTEMRNRIREMEKLRKERMKKKSVAESSKKPEKNSDQQMMISNPLESFMRDLSKDQQ